MDKLDLDVETLKIATGNAYELGQKEGLKQG